ncbi:MAG: thiamine diphosphokinase [Deltaproteobacteria bacterium]|nr:thiamine diphosphokinase [Deltaproteobacteria bacterium]MBN2845440.1 thiamine diphosphokinase [Deltaproteobacteria bacterium]
MKKKVFIVSGGIIEDHKFLKERLNEAHDPVIICADGASRQLLAHDIIPAVIIGDMDSAEKDILRYFKERGSEVVRFPKRKDETDTWLALEYAFKMKPDEIIILGALGGRIDHALANIFLLVMAAEKDVKTKIVDETSELFVVADTATIHGNVGDTVSLFPLSSSVSGINLEGFDYPLTDGEMEIGTPYGISNRLAEKRGTISVETGYLLVVRFYREVS